MTGSAYTPGVPLPPEEAPQQPDGLPAASPRQRRAVEGIEQARREAWGREQGALNRDAIKQAREEE